MPYPPGGIAGPDKPGSSAPPPKIVLPGPKPPKGQNEKAKFVAWATKLGAPAKVANDLWFWGQKYSLDPYYWASVLKEESHFSNKSDSGQATGIGQIAYSWVGSKAPWDKTHTITEADIKNYGFNIRFSAYLLADAVAQYGYDGAYLQGYNPNDGKKYQAWDRIQKHFPKGREFSPSQGPGEQPSAGRAPDTINADPWVTGVAKGGKLSLSSVVDPPKGTLKFDGTPMRQSDWLRLKRQMEETYVTYTGKRPSNAQIQQFVLKGWSVYKLTDLLSQTKSFTNSPLWKSKAPVYQEAAKNLLAPGQKADAAMIRKAVVNNWSPDTFQAELRKKQGYIQSNEYKGATATMSNVYQSIYGSPGESGQALIHEATLGGWSPDQFAAWLRSKDEYVYTPEYRAKATSLVEKLGFLMGNVATLQPTTAKPPPSNQPGGYGPLPDDPRIKGTAAINPGLALVAGTQR